MIRFRGSTSTCGVGTFLVAMTLSTLSAAHDPVAPAASASSGPGGGRSSSRPAELCAFERYREDRTKKGVVEWTVRNFGSERNPYTRNTSRMANGDYLLSDRGDERGVVAYDDFGNGAILGSMFLKCRSGDMWTTKGDSVSAVLYGKTERQSRPAALDIRAQDADPGFSRFGDLGSALWRSDLENFGPISYATERREQLFQVSARASEKNGRVHEYRWLLDPDRGWSPVHLEYVINGLLTGEARITLKRYGEVWFPGRIERYRRTWRAGTKPFHVLTIERAVFGGDLPDRLSERDIGIEVGTNVAIADLQAQTLRPVLMWDGAKPAPVDEVKRRVAAGELRFGANFERNVGSFKPRVITPESVLHGARFRWGRYLDAFLDEHELSAAQRIAAQGILDDCLKQAELLLAQRREDVQLYCQSLNRAPGPVAGEVQQRGAQMKRERDILRPLDQIYRSSLRPRLDALLTTQQDQASQPVRKRR